MGDHTVPSRGTATSALPRPFYRLAVGDAVSSYGSQLNMVALSLFAYQAAGSAIGTAGYLVLRLLGGFGAGLLAGRVVARVDRRLLMVGCAFTQATGLVALALVPEHLRIPVLYPLALLFGSAGTLSAVALRSSVPEMVGPQLRARANGVLVTGRSTAMVLGFASAGVLVAWAGFHAALLTDAASFAVFGAVVLRLPLRTRSDGGAEAAAPVRPGGRWAGLVLLRALPVVGAMVAIRLVDAFGSAAHNIGLPVFATQHAPGNPAGVLGLFWATWAVGSLGAHQLVSRLMLKRGREPGERAFAVGTALMSACFILAFTGLPTPLFLVVALGAGLADGFTEISYTTRVQAVDDDRRGQAFGLVASAESLGMGVGMLLSAGLMERFSPLTVVGFSHAVPIALAAGFLLLVGVGAGRRRAPAAPADDRALSDPA
ncbi:MFS transporter [Kitasatospora sp. NPDC052868]|uniref:MFS transporter n=1 Tax=Kitasatospora sp. NPDC052868 TaxID=3364060 RepID=UPI0037CA2485